MNAAFSGMALLPVIGEAAGKVVGTSVKVVESQALEAVAKYGDDVAKVADKLIVQKTTTSISKQIINAVGEVTENVAEQVVETTLEQSANNLIENNVKPYVNVKTGVGYDAGDVPVRIEGEWSINDMKQALLGHPLRGLGSPDIHHGGQMPGASLHEILPNEHRNNNALHKNKYNQGVTSEMRQSDRELHWWYRAREQGADELLPNWIYNN